VVLFGSAGAAIGAFLSAEALGEFTNLTWPMIAGAAAGLLLGRRWIR